MPFNSIAPKDPAQYVLAISPTLAEKTTSYIAARKSSSFQVRLPGMVESNQDRLAAEKTLTFNLSVRWQNDVAVSGMKVTIRMSDSDAFQLAQRLIEHARAIEGNRTKTPNYSQNELNQIVSSLEKVGAKEPCPRCRAIEFTVLDQKTVLADRERPGRLCVSTVCNNCGFVSNHLSDVLFPRSVVSISDGLAAHIGNNSTVCGQEGLTFAVRSTAVGGGSSGPKEGEQIGFVTVTFNLDEPPRDRWLFVQMSSSDAMSQAERLSPRLGSPTQVEQTARFSIG
jgi:hypothetical protein